MLPLPGQALVGLSIVSPTSTVEAVVANLEPTAQPPTVPAAVTLGMLGRSQVAPGISIRALPPPAIADSWSGGRILPQGPLSPLRSLPSTAYLETFQT